MRNTAPPIRYKVSKPLQAVKLAEHPGSSCAIPPARWSRSRPK